MAILKLLKEQPLPLPAAVAASKVTAAPPPLPQKSLNSRKETTVADFVSINNTQTIENSIQDNTLFIANSNNAQSENLIQSQILNLSNNQDNLKTLETFELIPKKPSKYVFTPTIVLISDSINACANQQDTNDSATVEETEFFKLSISGWKVLDGTVDAIALCLPSSVSLTTLSFWNSGLDDTHFHQLVAVLSLTNIKNLSLDQNPSINESNYHLLLNEDSQLKSLSLRSNFITDIGCKLISNCLKINRNLNSLNLWNNKIGKEGADSIAEALKVNQSLFSLSLGRNLVGDDGIVSLCKEASTGKKIRNARLQTPSQLAALRKPSARPKDQEDPQQATLQTKNGSKPEGNDSQNTTKKGQKLTKKEELEKKKLESAPNNNKDTGNTGNKKPNVQNKKNSPLAGGLGVIAGGSKEDLKNIGKDKKSGKDKGKGGKVKQDEVKEDVEEVANDVGTMEPMFELNGQYFIIGNRSLNNLNLEKNNLRVNSLKLIMDVLKEQELSQEIGLFRISLKDNNFEKENQLYIQIQNSLSTRNPFLEIPTEIVEKTVLENVIEGGSEISTDL
ncbi:Leucine-rich repeat-containing protein 71 [Clydaea vesicula]|uniref:Leucine-rich repeat-containing protein 71 n=1 Tax=Clydaea vesicula TaxID=447962 RepID=A0AAD5U8Y1_9FUNG|nr:Leucine-rich repeat-containing protein 71 [Clydaea vesicula]